MGANASANPVMDAESEQVECSADAVKGINLRGETEPSSTTQGSVESCSKTLLEEISSDGQTISGESGEEAVPEVPKIPKAKSAPVLLLPSRAVPNRRELHAQRGAEKAGSKSPFLPASCVRFDVDEGDGSTCLPTKSVNSPSTANSQSRRRKRRSVTFGDAELVQFVASIPGDA